MSGGASVLAAGLAHWAACWLTWSRTVLTASSDNKTVRGRGEPDRLQVVYSEDFFSSLKTGWFVVSRPIMCVERSAPRRVASPPVLVTSHRLLSARFCVTMPPDDLWFYIRRYRYDTLTATDDRGHAAAWLGTRHPASLSALRRAVGGVHWQVARPGHG